MVVDSVDGVIKTMPCFCEVVEPLLQLLPFVHIVDVGLRANRLRNSVPSWNYYWPRPLLTSVDLC